LQTLGGSVRVGWTIATTGDNRALDVTRLTLSAGD
jgi:hypothetical protein